MKKSMLIILLLAVLMSGVAAVSWSGYVATNTNSWQISRQSSNLSMDISGYVEGTVSPVERQGRVLSPYASYTRTVQSNGAALLESAAALQGLYSSEDQIMMKSQVFEFGYIWDKPAGTDVWTAEFYSNWPVTINYSRSLDYIGKNINNREFISNGEDNIGANFLYNLKLTKEQNWNLSAGRLNATILATNDSILQAELFENKEIDYRLESHSTGIADLKFTQSGAQYSTETGDYILAAQGEERYSGDYNIVRHIRMRSNFSREKEDDEWLPCCSSGWAEMSHRDKVGHSADSVFDCTCFEAEKKR